MEYGSQLLFLLTILYIAQAFFNTSTDVVTNTKAGLLGACLVFLAQSSLKPYKSPFIKIRDSFTRVGARMVVIYIGVLVFLLFQTAEHARGIFWYIDPKLNSELPIHNEYYDRNCDFTYENVSKIIDFYVLAHFANWFIAALILRDSYILHFWSVLDEILELSLKSIRPNFAECWWDSLLLDVVFANTAGIFLGMCYIRAVGSMEYDWLGRKDAKSIWEWKIWTQHRYFAGTTLLIIFVSVNFVTGFSVSNSLWIPPNHWLNLIRLAVWFTIGVLGFRETFDDMRSWGDQIRKEKQVLAQHRWAAWMCLFCEAAITYKFREKAGNNLDASISNFVLIPWSIIVVVCLLYYIYLRFFYKYRIYKDGRYMDSSLQLEKEKLSQFNKQ